MSKSKRLKSTEDYLKKYIKKDDSFKVHNRPFNLNQPEQVNENIFINEDDDEEDDEGGGSGPVIVNLKEYSASQLSRAPQAAPPVPSSPPPVPVPSVEIIKNETIFRIGHERVSQEEFLKNKNASKVLKQKRKDYNKAFDEKLLTHKTGLTQLEEGEIKKLKLTQISNLPITNPNLEGLRDREGKGKTHWGDPILTDKAQTAQNEAKRAPWNRFNISPGNRWDGVVRGSNYEAKWAEGINLKKFKEHETYQSQMDI